VFSFKKLRPSDSDQKWYSVLGIFTMGFFIPGIFPGVVWFVCYLTGIDVKSSFEDHAELVLGALIGLSILAIFIYMYLLQVIFKPATENIIRLKRFDYLLNCVLALAALAWLFSTTWFKVGLIDESKIYFWTFFQMWIVPLCLSSKGLVLYIGEQSKN